MASPIKRIGVLTGGGDCPGLNAVIRAVSKTAMFDHGWEVVGIRDGFLGLIEDRVTPLSADDVSGILAIGGTILGSSNKANPETYATGTDADGNTIWSDVTGTCLETIERHRLDAIVAIGGDGTMSGAQPFIEAGVNVIGVPKTIDNDIVGTELSFGFVTAADIATEALDRIHTTAESHQRAIVVEVMGRNAGWIALHAGVASGSDVILIPEIPYDLEEVAAYTEYRRSIGRNYTIICISEGAAPKGGQQAVRQLDPTSPDPVKLGGIARQMAHNLQALTGQDSRATVLGHVQRGGAPTPADRVLATRFGHEAAMILERGKRNRMVAFVGGDVTDIDITIPANKQRTIPADNHLLQAARAVGTCFGDG